MVLIFQWTILWYNLKRESCTAITRNEAEIIKTNSQDELLSEKSKIYLP